MAALDTTFESPGLLRVHLLGQVEFDQAVQLQRRLAYRLGGGESGAALLLCEHPPQITVGRHGSSLAFLRDELNARGWRVRWVARGGGTILHLPGQLAIYPILPLQRLGIGLDDYLVRFQQVLLDLLDDFGVRGTTRADDPGIWVADRRIASIGIAIRRQISTFGAVFNLDPDLTLFRVLHSISTPDGYTSLARERHGPLRAQLVRERFVEHFSTQFGFDRIDVIFPGSDQPGHTRLPVGR